MCDLLPLAIHEQGVLHVRLEVDVELVFRLGYLRGESISRCIIVLITVLPTEIFDGPQTNTR